MKTLKETIQITVGMILLIIAWSIIPNILMTAVDSKAQTPRSPQIHQQGPIYTTTFISRRHFNK